ncbi:MAG: GNAT family N-acetyltransferase [Arenicella sp.]
MMKIIELKPSETLVIRQAVLWPEKEMDFCRVDGDNQASHFGVVQDNRLVCVASVYFDASDKRRKIARLRKFATLHEFQGLGIGSFMLEHVISYVVKSEADFMWFDARESAISFYSRFGFQCEGDRFYKSGVPYFKMSRQF